MISDYEFFNTETKIGKIKLYRVSIREYLILLELIERIKNAKSLHEINTWKLKIIALTTNLKKPKKKHLNLFDTVMRYNIPPTSTTNEKNPTKMKRTDFYSGILMLIDTIVHEYASVSFDEILNYWNIFQIMITYKLIRRRCGNNYLELTSIFGLAQNKPSVLFERFSAMGREDKPSSKKISLAEAFRLSGRKNNA